MAIEQADNVQTGAPKPTDSRYYNNLVPYTGTTEANTLIDSGVRYTGLTVNVAGTEYWYKDGITDPDLVVKESGGGSGLLNWTGSTANAIGTYISVSGICAQPNLIFDGNNLCVNASDGVTGFTRIKGGNIGVTAIGEINSALEFGSNDASVQSTGQVGGKIVSVTEATNGANVGMGFYTYKQTGNLLTEKMRISNDGDICMLSLPAKVAETNIIYIDTDGSLATGATSGGGGVAVSGTTDNAITTYINASGDLCAESSLTYNGTSIQMGRRNAFPVNVCPQNEDSGAEAATKVGLVGQRRTGFGANSTAGDAVVEGGCANNPSSSPATGGKACLVGGRGVSISSSTGGETLIEGGCGSASGTGAAVGGTVKICGGDGTVAAGNSTGGDVCIYGGVGTGGAATVGCVALSHGTSTKLLTTTAGIDVCGSINLCESGTATRNIQMGQGRTGNGYTYIDLIGDATYTDFGLRIMRSNTGANTESSLCHRGTGALHISTNENAPVQLRHQSDAKLCTTPTGIEVCDSVSISNSTNCVCMEYNATSCTLDFIFG